MGCDKNTLQVAEISRVLRPGGVFVASTILNPSSGIGSIVGDDTIRPIKQVSFLLGLKHMDLRACVFLAAAFSL